MPLSLYNKYYVQFFVESNRIEQQMTEAVSLLSEVKRIFFIGNGGSNSICSHMMEDYLKIAKFQTFTFSDPALITCFANDYGYENAMKEWVKAYFTKDDLLIAISSSGESPNILNAVNTAKELGGKVITLSGFKERNTLSESGMINFYLPAENYGIVECFHQVILHGVLDKFASNNN
jgi:D-sedoheptulose 7-phosphate isomerase